MSRHRLVALCALALLAAAGCDSRAPGGGVRSDAAPATAAPSPSPSVAPAKTTSGPVGARPGAGDRYIVRTRELVNPDNSTMVFLYFDLAGVTPPLDEWVETDQRVQVAAPLDKPARRATVRAELEAGLAAVHDVGRLRLSLASAQLSDYDPANGEFTVRALGPASELGFNALGQKVVTRFANGETAQLWRVPAAQAQAVRDKTVGRDVGLDAVLKIVDVQPGPGGGVIVTNVESYALHAADGSTLARVP